MFRFYDWTHFVWNYDGQYPLQGFFLMFRNPYKEIFYVVSVKMIIDIMHFDSLQSYIESDSINIQNKNSNHNLQLTLISNSRKKPEFFHKFLIINAYLSISKKFLVIYNSFLRRFTLYKLIST